MDDAPEYLLAHIREALATDHRVGELNVDVALAGERLFLTGDVASDELRAAIGDVVREVAPDMDVHNEVNVVHPSEPTQPEALS
ncbi:MAG: BON domain-containing protein [Actinomycetota bacterium]|nr:BON domain-containing protein [Actinomycetota bacterium]